MSVLFVTHPSAQVMLQAMHPRMTHTLLRVAQRLVTRALPRRRPVHHRLETIIEQAVAANSKVFKEAASSLNEANIFATTIAIEKAAFTLKEANILAISANALIIEKATSTLKEANEKAASSLKEALQKTVFDNTLVLQKSASDNAAIISAALTKMLLALLVVGLLVLSSQPSDSTIGKVVLGCFSKHL